MGSVSAIIQIMGTISTAVDTCKATIGTSKGTVDTIKARIDAIEAEIDSIKATVDMILIHDLEGAMKKLLCVKKYFPVFRLRDLLAQESQPRSGRIMTFGYNAGITWQKWDDSKAPKFEGQSLWGSGTSLTAQNAGDTRHRPTQRLDRGIGGKRAPPYIDKHNEAFPYFGGRQGSLYRCTAVDSATDEATYTSQDVVLKDIYQVGVEQRFDYDSPARAACSKYCKLVVRYLRLHTAIKRFIAPAVFLGCPTVVSAAAVPTRCNLCSSGISTLPSSSIHVQGILTKSIESVQPDWAQSSNVVLMLPSPPGRQVLQYLAFCSVASVLVYFQRTGPYLKHSFLVFSGLLGLICVSAGTETMLKLLPSVALVTLLASWVCQILIKMIRALRPYEVRDEPVATPGCATQGICDKDPKSLVN